MELLNARLDHTSVYTLRDAKKDCLLNENCAGIESETPASSFATTNYPAIMSEAGAEHVPNRNHIAYRSKKVSSIIQSYIFVRFISIMSY